MPGGSQEMIDAGCLENVDRFTVHIYGVVILLELFIHVRGQSWPLQMNLASQLKVVNENFEGSILQCPRLNNFI